MPNAKCQMQNAPDILQFSLLHFAFCILHFTFLQVQRLELLQHIGDAAADDVALVLQR
jgi:hypothetical protein